MFEEEIENETGAMFFLANEVINEYHGFPVVCRADVGEGDSLFILLNGNWYSFRARRVYASKLIERLEELAG
jgi:hypothetical protein